MPCNQSGPAIRKDNVYKPIGIFIRRNLHEFAFCRYCFQRTLDIFHFLQKLDRLRTSSLKIIRSTFNVALQFLIRFLPGASQRTYA